MRAEIDGRLAEQPFEQEIVVLEQFTKTRFELPRLLQLADAHRAARDLVLVGGADAASRRADLAATGRAFARAVDQCVRREHERAQRAHEQPLEHGNSAPGQHVGLGQQRLEGNDDAVADKAAHAIAQHARRDQRQHGLHAVDHERVAGIVPALEPRDGRDTLGQQVDDLALALIAPLGADYDDESTHGCASAADQPEDQQPAEHARGARHAEAAIIDRAESRERAPDGARAQEWQDAFDHEQKPERGREIGPCDVHRRFSDLTVSGT